MLCPRSKIPEVVFPEATHGYSWLDLLVSRDSAEELRTGLIEYIAVTLEIGEVHAFVFSLTLMKLWGNSSQLVKLSSLTLSARLSKSIFNSTLRQKLFSSLGLGFMTR